MYLKSPEGKKFRSTVEVKAHLKKTNSTITFEELGFPLVTSKSRTIPTTNKKKAVDSPKTRTKPAQIKKKAVKKNQSKYGQLDYREVLHDDPNLPEGWYRKTVQRQSGKTAGVWDIYIYK